MRVLVVDDEKALVKGIKFNLELDGYEVDTAYDGEEAVEKVRSGGVDLVIMDLMMPKKNGLDACLEIRSFSKLPIIMLTAKSEDNDKIIGFEYGVSESASMKRYLMEQGVPAERIIEEDRSTDTRENMRFSKEKIWAIDPGAKVAFCTTNYHVFRSGLFARRVKMRAVGMGAKTKWYFWPNAAVREFVGLLTQHLDKQVLILGSMAAAYVILTVASYYL